MALNSLFQSNNFDLFSRSLTTKTVNCDEINITGDSPVVTFSNFYFYTKNGSNYQVQRGPGTFYYKVHKNLFTFWARSSTGDFTFNNSLGNTTIYLGPFDIGTNQPLPFNIPYLLVSADGDFCNLVNCKVNNVDYVCKMQINSNVNNVNGDWDIRFFPIGNPYLDNTGSAGTTQGIFTGTLNFCNFFISAPCELITT